MRGPTPKAFGIDLAGIVAVSGGESHARATSDPSTRTRRVTADTRADATLLDGLIRLTGMSFHLEQTSFGDDARTSERAVASSVDFGTLSIAGVPVPLPDDPSAAAGQLNTLLGPLGVKVLPPELLAQGRFGQQLTPLTLRIGGDSANSDLLAQLVGNPQLTDLQRQLQDGLFDSVDCDQLAGLLQPYPQLNSIYNAIGIAAPIFIAVLVNALAGGGSIDVQIGGARTRIDDTAYAPAPFTRPTAGAVPTASPSPTGAMTSPGQGAATGPAPAATAPPAVRAAAVTTCATTSPAARPGCWSGLAPIGAIGAFLLFGGLLVADEVRRRHLAQLEPTEMPR